MEQLTYASRICNLYNFDKISRLCIWQHMINQISSKLKKWLSNRSGNCLFITEQRIFKAKALLMELTCVKKKRLAASFTLYLPVQRPVRGLFPIISTGVSRNSTKVNSNCTNKKQWQVRGTKPSTLLPWAQSLWRYRLVCYQKNVNENF